MTAKAHLAQRGKGNPLTKLARYCIPLLSLHFLRILPATEHISLKETPPRNACKPVTTLTCIEATLTHITARVTSADRGHYHLPMVHVRSLNETPPRNACKPVTTLTCIEATLTHITARVTSADRGHYHLPMVHVRDRGHASRHVSLIAEPLCTQPARCRRGPTVWPIS